MILFSGTSLIAGTATAAVAAVYVISTAVAVVEMATEPESVMATDGIGAATEMTVI